MILPFSSQQRKTTRTAAAGHLEEEDLQLQPPAEEELGQVGGDKGRPISGFANANMFNGHNFKHNFVQLNMMWIGRMFGALLFMYYHLNES